jgi:hypothetical protein
MREKRKRKENLPRAHPKENGDHVAFISGLGNGFLAAFICNGLQNKISAVIRKHD